MRILEVGKRGVLYQILKRNHRRKFREIMEAFHPQGFAQGPMMRGRKDLVYAIKDDWVVLMTIHLLNNFEVSRRFKLSMDRTVFLRRILTVPGAKEKHGDVAVEALEALISYLKRSGYEAVVTLSLPRHTGALYRYAGFQPAGVTVKGNMTWWILRLK